MKSTSAFSTLHNGSNEKLTYEEWCVLYFGQITIPEDVKEDLKRLHNVDADKEIEVAIRKRYDYYLNRESMK